MNVINREDWGFPGERHISFNSESQRSLCQFPAAKKKLEKELCHKGEIPQVLFGLVKNAQSVLPRLVRGFIRHQCFSLHRNITQAPFRGANVLASAQDSQDLLERACGWT